MNTLILFALLCMIYLIHTANGAAPTRFPTRSPTQKPTKAAPTLKPTQLPTR